MPLRHPNGRHFHLQVILRAIVFVLVVDAQQQLLCTLSRDVVAAVRRARDAKLQGFLRLLAGISFGEARTLASQPQLSHVPRLPHDLLHVGAVPADDPPSHFELVVVVDANKESTCVLALPPR